VKLSRIVFLPLVLLLVCVSAAMAAPAKQYALAYAWHQDLQQALDDRNKLTHALTPPANRPLQVVGKNGEYGIIYPLHGTLAQARQLAIKQSHALALAGFTSADLLPEGSYSPLYNLQLTQGSDLKAVRRTQQRLAALLPSTEQGKLHIEKTSARGYALVYRCWADRAEAGRLASQQRALLKSNQAPVLVAALERPSLANINNLSETNQATASSPSAKDCRLAGPTPEPNSRTSKGASAGKAQAAGINSKIQDFLREQRNKGRLQQRDMTALVAFDLTNNTYLASVNAQRSFQAASMIKPFVALAFFDQVEHGKLKYTPTHRQMMEEMIQHSDNEATNWFIRQVGGPARCNAVINGQYGKLFSKVRIVEYIPPGGRTYKNSALPQDYVQFLRALWNNQLPHSQEMLRVMSLPGRDRIFSGTEVPPGTLVYNKTGTTSLLCGDMGILVTRSKNGLRVPYAVVGIVERPTLAKDYKQWMQTGGGVIRDFSTLVYEEMKQKYNLL